MTRRTPATIRTWTCARWCSIRRIPTSRGSDPTVVSCATTATTPASPASAGRSSTTPRSARPCCRASRRGCTSSTRACRPCSSTTCPWIPRRRSRRLIGGLQDNGTIWLGRHDDARVWKTLFPSGDGTSASGFHPTRAAVRFASVQSNRFFTNFRNGDPMFWVRTDDPITRARGTRKHHADHRPAVHDVRCGAARHAVHRLPARLAHAEQWRPAGGTRSHCRVFVGSASPGQTCGDWLPLGVAFPFQAGSTADSASRRPGDLTSDFYGGDRTGGFIVAAERSPRRYWHAVGRDQQGPAVRQQERRCRRRRRVTFTRVIRTFDAGTLRHAHLRRSLRSECRVSSPTRASTR